MVTALIQNFTSQFTWLRAAQIADTPSSLRDGPFPETRPVIRARRGRTSNFTQRPRVAARFCVKFVGLMRGVRDTRRDSESQRIGLERGTYTIVRPSDVVLDGFRRVWGLARFCLGFHAARAALALSCGETHAVVPQTLQQARASGWIFGARFPWALRQWALDRDHSFGALRGAHARASLGRLSKRFGFGEQVDITLFSREPVSVPSLETRARRAQPRAIRAVTRFLLE